MIKQKKLTKVQLETMVMEFQEKETKKQSPKLRNYITISIGCGIPLLSLAMSNIGGNLIGQQTMLSLFAFLLMGAVLVVSLPHLAWSIKDITKSDKLASWSFAIALDLSLVLCELVHVYTTELKIITTVVIVAVAGTSMVLNCWAFKNNQH